MSNQQVDMSKEWSYIYEERLAILGVSHAEFPTQEQMEMARQDANQWCKDLKKKHIQTNKPK